MSRPLPARDGTPDTSPLNVSAKRVEPETSEIFAWVLCGGGRIHRFIVCCAVNAFFMLHGERTQSLVMWFLTIVFAMG